MPILIFTLAFNVLLFARIGCLAHWSYVIGSAVYPTDNHRKLQLSGGIFGFIFLSALIPGYFFPRIKLAATALSIPPQIHMLVLLQKSVRATRIENSTVLKAVWGYTALTVVSAAWSIYSLLQLSV